MTLAPLGAFTWSAIVRFESFAEIVADMIVVFLDEGALGVCRRISERLRVPLTAGSPSATRS
jgi:hypothetical protein